MVPEVSLEAGCYGCLRSRSAALARHPRIDQSTFLSLYLSVVSPSRIFTAGSALWHDKLFRSTVRHTLTHRRGWGTTRAYKAEFDRNVT